MSEGDYVSLGFFEMKDLESVIKYIRESEKASTIGLWGRSMGAVTALMYGDSDPTIAGMILDSPFKSLHALCLEMVDKLQGEGGWKVFIIKNTSTSDVKINLSNYQRYRC